MDVFQHQPVMLKEVMEFLNPQPEGTYVDCTLGGGGHSMGILERTGGRCRLVGLDQDTEALEAAGKRLSVFGDRVQLVRANFRELTAVLERLGIGAVQGVFYDLGVSSHQLDTRQRGFSYQHDAPLDMRMDPDGGITAADLVNELTEKELTRLIREYGEERWAGRIAGFIARERARSPIFTTGRLAAVIKEAVPARARRTGPHPARRTFQALRIAVNDELGSLAHSLKQAVAVLAGGGRIVVLSYHSLEDRIVKETFRELAVHCKCPPGLPVCRCGVISQLDVLTSRPRVPGDKEIAGNPRARSAKLRAARKRPAVLKNVGVE
ncbi:MAG: 16S rRNA (cytosine(1402)-N(4))-methyltransferase RsmH [Candidatus Desulforudis sp.]|nr:16S rRNA (cytosine(1402)-N(4))-methyltransferase RsmH [Desulforudis sp.]